jgi:hypothetical protein
MIGCLRLQQGMQPTRASSYWLRCWHIRSRPCSARSTHCPPERYAAVRCLIYRQVCLTQFAGAAMLGFLCLTASSALLSPSLLRVIGQGPAQRAVVARATTPRALPTWFDSDWVDERLEAFAPLVGKEGFGELTTAHVDGLARLSVSVLVGPWAAAAGPLARVSAVLLVGATPFLLHLIERIIERILIRARSWIRDMLRGDWPWRWRARCRRAPLRPPLCAPPPLHPFASTAHPHTPTPAATTKRRRSPVRMHRCRMLLKCGIAPPASSGCSQQAVSGCSQPVTGRTVTDHLPADHLPPPLLTPDSCS